MLSPIYDSGHRMKQLIDHILEKLNLSDNDQTNIRTQIIIPELKLELNRTHLLKNLEKL